MVFSKMEPPAVDHVRPDQALAARKSRGTAQAETVTPERFLESSTALKREQILHFTICNVLPLPLAIGGAIWSASRGLTWLDIALLILMYLLTTIGIEVGYHRAFTHRAFQARPWLNRALAILGAMAGQGSPGQWVAIHRLHHLFADRDGDPHSPTRGLIHAHWSWMLAPKMPSVRKLASDVLACPDINLSTRTYYATWASGLVSPGLVALCITGEPADFWSGVIWGGLVRLVLVQHGVYFINSGGHTAGERRFHLRDRSRNIHILALLTFGGSLHNNHHAAPSAITTALQRGDVDPGAWVIRGLARLGLVTNMVEPRDRLATALRDKP